MEVYGYCFIEEDGLRGRNGGWEGRVRLEAEVVEKMVLLS